MRSVRHSANAPEISNEPAPPSRRGRWPAMPSGKGHAAVDELLIITLQHCRVFRTAHFSHHPRSKAINMSANCATWTSERIELLKRCLHAGLSCGRIAREIGVHPQRCHRQDEPPGPIAAQGCDRQAAGAKACRKACAPQDSKDLALKASAPEHLRPA